MQLSTVQCPAQIKQGVRTLVKATSLTFGGVFSDECGPCGWGLPCDRSQGCGECLVKKALLARKASRSLETLASLGSYRCSLLRPLSKVCGGAVGRGNTTALPCPLVTTHANGRIFANRPASVKPITLQMPSRTPRSIELWTSILIPLFILDHLLWQVAKTHHFISCGCWLLCMHVFKELIAAFELPSLQHDLSLFVI